MIIIFCTAPQITNAQEINFGDFHDYTITLDNVTMGDLEFEGPIERNSGVHKVELSDAYILELIGVEYLDVGVTIEADGVLFLDGEETSDPNKRIPFTLEAAYANRGQENSSDAQLITIDANSSQFGDTRFPVLARQQAAPGPPPRPPTSDFDQSEVNESAFIYLYGQIDVGDVDAGKYIGTITIHVQYDAPPELE